MSFKISSEELWCYGVVVTFGPNCVKDNSLNPDEIISI